MSETAKTLFFLAAAGVALAAAFFVAPSGQEFNVEELVGEKLNEFGVDAPKRLRIVKFDRETAKPVEFEVAEQDGLWAIPSKNGYPADAARQMAEAATSLIDLEILGVVATSASEHAEMGVVNPSDSSLNSKSEGVGTRVTLTDNDGNTLTDMILGKEVRDAEGQHYVRNANQDAVYVVAVSTDALSTRFDDWIEDDLLKLSPLDVRRVKINDYSAELQPRFTGGGIAMEVIWKRRSDMTLRYDNAESKWLPVELKKFDPESESMVEFTLAEGETLDDDALQKLKTGLDDLVIVDVEKKPAGLSADLKAGGDFVTNQEAYTNLISRGFAPVGTEENPDGEILSSEGEVVCTLDDGVEYVLRFGNLQMDAEGNVDEAKNTGDDDEKPADVGINRYLFVMARYNDAMIEKPQLEELPELPADAPATEEAPAAEETSETTDAATEETENSETATVENETEPEAETPAGQESSEENAEQKTEEPSELDRVIAERREISQENERKQDAYNKQVEAAKKRVKELNERFGDWYYVIDNKVYDQIHLSREELIKQADEKSDQSKGGDQNSGVSGLPNIPLDDVEQ